MNKEKFKQDISLLSINKTLPKGQHLYTPNEDAAAFYLAFINNNKKDDIDLVVTRLNLFSGNSLKQSSFTMRIANMKFELYKQGKERNSEQGKLVAQYITKFVKDNNLNRLQLKECINFLFGRDIV
jgi:hypothetical protein